jgi:ABC-type transport system involved in multi-copper enzyme maturation permease subunit
VPIHDQGYRRYQGPLGHAWTRWLPIARSDFVLAFRNKKMLALYAVCVSPFIGSLLMLYLMSVNGWKTAPSEMRESPFSWLVDPSSIDFYLGPVLRVSFLLVVLYTTAVGSGIVARDRRVNALELYFTRGIARGHYVVGKWGAVTALLAMQLLIPTLVIWIYGVLIAPDWELLEQTSAFMPSVALGIFVLCAFMGFLLVGVSAATSSATFAGLLWVLLLSFLSTVGVMLRRLLHENSWVIISPWFAAKKMVEQICGVVAAMDFPWERAALAMTAYAALAAFLLWKNLKAVEVVG